MFWERGDNLEALLASIQELAHTEFWAFFKLLQIRCTLRYSSMRPVKELGHSGGTGIFLFIEPRSEVEKLYQLLA